MDTPTIQADKASHERYASRAYLIQSELNPGIVITIRVVDVTGVKPSCHGEPKFMYECSDGNGPCWVPARNLASTKAKALEKLAACLPSVPGDRRH